MPLRRATVEDVRQALTTITAELAPSSARQVVLRVKSLLSYGHRLGYLPFNAGAVIRVHAEARAVSQRIVSEVEMGLLVRAAPSRRDRILIEVGYGGGLRVSELVALTWADVIERDGGKVQLSVLGKGNKRREVLLPEVVGRSLLSLRGDAGANDPVFALAQGRAPHRARRELHAEARRRCGGHQRKLLRPLAPPCPRQPRHRARRGPARGAGDPRPRQHLCDVRLSARAARQLERPLARSWGVSSMTT